MSPADRYRGWVKALQGRRRDKKWSMDMLAAQMGLAPRTVYAWESMERTPSIMMLMSWAEILDYQLELTVKQTD